MRLRWVRERGYQYLYCQDTVLISKLEFSPFSSRLSFYRTDTTVRVTALNVLDSLSPEVSAVECTVFSNSRTRLCDIEREHPLSGII